MSAPDIESLLPFPVPPRRRPDGARARTRERLRDRGQRLAVLDDDPTGTQTVHDVPVYLEWSGDSLAEALREPSEVVYISTNSRALAREEAADLARELGAGIRAAEERTGVRALIASRSDSTLRGHYPAEVDAFIEGHGRPVDGVIICPAFFEGGRCTAGDVHYVLQGTTLTPAAETEFARDPVFGYSSSNLREWVAEKVDGMRADAVPSVSLDDIRRGGAERVAALLAEAAGGIPIIVNALAYEDLDEFVLGLAAAEDRGKRFLYRCAASLVKARGGVEDRPLLTSADLAVRSGVGLVVVGSWVERTSEQLSLLLREAGLVGVELDAEACAADDPAAREACIEGAASAAEETLGAGRTAVVYTSRRPVAGHRGRFSEIGGLIMGALCEVAKRITTKPGFVVAKGGITSIEVARAALGARRATVLGQIESGVPVWRLDPTSRWADLPYVVFPGNVGGESALRDVVESLRGAP
jgi:uncharacterized protein YgbK (DUF1537 family)